MLDPNAQAEAMKMAGLDSQGQQQSGALTSGIIGPDSVPSPEYLKAQVDTGNVTVPELVQSGLPPEQIQEFADAEVAGQVDQLVPPQDLNQPAIDAAAPQLEAIAEGVIDPTAEPSPDQFDPRGEGTAAQKPSADLKPAEKAAEVKTKVDEVVNNTDEEEFKGDQGSIHNTGREVLAKDPSALQKIGGKLKEFFGDLFDADELKRMGVLALGAMATGASPGQAFAFAGKNYISRIDAKESNQLKLESDLVKGGKYTTASIKEYMKSQDPSVLQPTEAAGGYKELGNQKEFYGPQGNRVLAREVEDASGNKIWVGPQGNPISLNQYHQDASRVQGTAEYRDRVSKDSQSMTDLVKGLRKQNEFTGKDGSKQYPTGLVPEVAGGNIAKWAIQNNVDPAEMSSIVSAAYDQAVAESNGGKKVKRIEAYLNDQYIRATTDSNNQLFEGATAEKLNMFINSISNYGGLQGSPTAKSQIIIGEFKPDWMSLEPEVREQWDKKAGDGQSGFMIWLQNEMAKEL